MAELLDVSPPASLGEDRCWLPPSERSPGVARRRLAALLARVEGGHRFLDGGLLLVSELVTNAVLHGTPRGNLLCLVLAADRERLRIEVHGARADRAPVLRRAGAQEESGRGLLLVKSLAQRWGCCPRGVVGKIVWCEIGPAAGEWGDRCPSDRVPQPHVRLHVHRGVRRQVAVDRGECAGDVDGARLVERQRGPAAPFGQ
ncbi:anti-sigma regulatory factor (Ser/Thr protein kinase) [Kitasatospora viridis]|uniref:Anti-sigma regulatory factor (Ser/Thr protein kinase) n=1 Tax=Kitasatospora viridis TaxID=281105 RepID=A0A561UBP8_9ACTN|nr:anti-sigma regulatory factor (Ser/Thr protein kinase) [Kitasatospora viridis]